MDNHLVLAALGADKTGIVDEIARSASESKCNIADSRMVVMGQEFSLIMMVSGTWDAIAKFETQVPMLERRLNLSIITKRTAQREPQRESMPYNVDVIALDNPGIVHEIANFFASQGINIESSQNIKKPSRKLARCTLAGIFTTILRANIGEPVCGAA